MLIQDKRANPYLYRGMRDRFEPQICVFSARREEKLANWTLKENLIESVVDYSGLSDETKCC